MRFPHPPPLSFPFTHRPLYTYSSYPTFGQLLKNTVEALRFYIPIDLSCTTNGIKAMNSSTRQRGERLFIFFSVLVQFYRYNIPDSLRNPPIGIIGVQHGVVIWIRMKYIVMRLQESFLCLFLQQVNHHMLLMT